MKGMGHKGKHNQPEKRKKWAGAVTGIVLLIGAGLLLSVEPWRARAPGAEASSPFASLPTPTVEVSKSPSASSSPVASSALVSGSPTPNTSVTLLPSVEIPGTDRYQKMVKQGTVEFEAARGGNIVRLPLYSIQASYGIDQKTDGQPPAVAPIAPLPPIAYDIPLEQADQLAAYWMNSGNDTTGYLVLAPDGWRSASSAVGVDGSFVIVLENPSVPAQTMTFSDTGGGCQGCAISSIGSYFPDMAKWAAEMGFEPEKQMEFKTMEADGANLIRYSRYGTNKELLHGIAFKQTEEGNVWFKHQEISLPDEQNSLRKVILDFFKTFTGAFVGHIDKK